MEFHIPGWIGITGIWDPMGWFEVIPVPALIPTQLFQGFGHFWGAEGVGIKNWQELEVFLWNSRACCAPFPQGMWGRGSKV